MREVEIDWSTIGETPDRRDIFPRYERVTVVRTALARIFMDGRPVVQGLVARDLRHGRTWSVGYDEVSRAGSTSFPAGPDDLVILYDITLEMYGWLRVGWRLPAHVVDLREEVRVASTGRVRYRPAALAAVLRRHDIPEEGLGASRPFIMQEGLPDDQQGLLDQAHAELMAMTQLVDRREDRLEANVASGAALRRGRERARLAEEYALAETWMRQTGRL